MIPERRAITAAYERSGIVDRARGKKGAQLSPDGEELRNRAPERVPRRGEETHERARRPPPQHRLDLALLADAGARAQEPLEASLERHPPRISRERGRALFRSQQDEADLAPVALPARLLSHAVDRPRGYSSETGSGVIADRRMYTIRHTPSPSERNWSCV